MILQTKSKAFQIMMEVLGAQPFGMPTMDLRLRRAALYPAELRALRLVSLAEFRSEGNAFAPKPAHPSAQSGSGGLTRACQCLTAQLSRLERSALRGFGSTRLAAALFAFLAALVPAVA